MILLENDDPAKMMALENKGTKLLPMIGYVFKVRVIGFSFRVKIRIEFKK